MKVVAPITSFSGKHDFLSNFYPSTIAVGSIFYPTVEHAYQAKKTLNESERQRIATLPTPGQAKREGRMLDIRPDWDDVKIYVMLTLLRKKFLNPVLAEKLLATGNAALVEGNIWGDTFWGVCGGKGENHLGKLLMQVREELRDDEG